MQEFPHRYQVSATAGPEENVTLESPGLEDLPSAAPAEFGGPGDQWSPETLLVASVADCFVLSFRAVARASKFEWQSLSAEVEGVLDRVDGVSRFTRFTTRARLVVAAGTDERRARMLLEKAEKVCLVSNSLVAERHIESEIVVA